MGEGQAYVSQVTQRSGADMASKRRLQTSRAQAGGSRDLEESDRLQGVRLDEAHRSVKTRWTGELLDVTVRRERLRTAGASRRAHQLAELTFEHTEPHRSGLGAGLARQRQATRMEPVEGVEIECIADGLCGQADLQDMPFSRFLTALYYLTPRSRCRRRLPGSPPFGVKSSVRFPYCPPRCRVLC